MSQQRPGRRQIAGASIARPLRWGGPGAKAEERGARCWQVECRRVWAWGGRGMCVCGWGRRPREVHVVVGDSGPDIGRYPREPPLRAGGGSDGGAGSRRFLGRNVGRCATGHTVF